MALVANERRCASCGRAADELHYSCAVGGVCCERCHCSASPQASLAALRYKPPAPRPAPKPSEYAQLVERVWKALERVGTVFPLCDGTGTIIGRCPSCALGTITLRVLGTEHEPRLRIPDDGCSDGCAWQTIAEVIG